MYVLLFTVIARMTLIFYSLNLRTKDVLNEPVTVIPFLPQYIQVTYTHLGHGKLAINCTFILFKLVTTVIPHT